MKILPAIDILNGECVRLYQGEFESKKVYAKDPLAMAQKFEQEGAKMLHIVDLDAAKNGTPVNQELICNIAQTISIPIEVGSGIRDTDIARKYIKGGAEKIVVGTKAMTDPRFVTSLISEFGSEKIIVAIETNKGKIAIRGWQETINKNYLDVAKELQVLGVTQILFTDIERDGSLTEPNFEAIKELIALGFRVTASGGISDIASIRKLKAMGVNAAILGKALYENKIDLKEVLEALEPKSNLTKRIIPCLDVKDGRVVKGVHFQDLVDAGDPVELGRFYSEIGADELVFLDITATIDARKTLRELVKKIAAAIQIPFTVGGGIKSIDDIRELLIVGADKISLGSAAVTNPELVRDGARHFGSQCIVISIDAKRKSNTWEVYIKGGSEATGIDAISFAQKMEKLGAGELLVNSLDRDGTKEGFDIELLNKIKEVVAIPVIASSGAGSMEDFIEVFRKTNVDAALAASIFHSGNVSIQKLKNYLSEQDISIRER